MKNQRVKRCKQFLLLTFASAAVASATSSSAQQSTKTHTYDALGRLIASASSGGAHDRQVRSICYDSSDNRVTYQAASNGGLAPCVDDGTGSSPAPGNNPPVAVNDARTTSSSWIQHNVTANDSDPDGDPIEIVSATVSAPATVSHTATTISVTNIYQTTVVSYTISDGRGGTDSATFTIVFSGGGCNPICP